MLMVQNSTNLKEVSYEDQNLDILKEDKVEISFERKIKNCIQQLSKDPKEETIENILNYSKNFSNL